MDEARAREILGWIIRPDNSLYATSWISWTQGKEPWGVFTGSFTPDQLEAIAWWMRNKKIKTTYIRHKQKKKFKYVITEHGESSIFDCLRASPDLIKMIYS